MSLSVPTGAESDGFRGWVELEKGAGAIFLRLYLVLLVNPHICSVCNKRLDTMPLLPQDQTSEHVGFSQFIMKTSVGEMSVVSPGAMGLGGGSAAK